MSNLRTAPPRLTFLVTCNSLLTLYKLRRATKTLWYIFISLFNQLSFLMFEIVCSWQLQYYCITVPNGTFLLHILYIYCMQFNQKFLTIWLIQTVMPTALKLSLHVYNIVLFSVARPSFIWIKFFQFKFKSNFDSQNIIHIFTVWPLFTWNQVIQGKLHMDQGQGKLYKSES